MSTYIGLYFPYIHFPNDNWVKRAVLYWDKIARIVPSGYVTNRDTELVDELRKGGDDAFIKDVHPYEYADEMAGKFRCFVENHADELREYYDIDNRGAWPIDSYTLHFAPESADARLAYIYDEKIEGELRDVLLKTNLGTLRGREKESHWIGMHPKIASVYMNALAETIAEKRLYHPLADNTNDFFSVNGFTFDRLAQYLLPEAKFTPPTVIKGQELKTVLATLAIESVLPENIDDLEIDEILAIREKHFGELGKYQNYISSIIENFPALEGVSDPKVVTEHLQIEYNKFIKPKLDELTATYNDMKIGTVKEILNIELNAPKLLLGLSSLAHIAIDPIIGGITGAAIGLMTILSDRKIEEKEAIKKSEVAYLFHIKKGLEPKDSLAWLKDKTIYKLYGIKEK